MQKLTRTATLAEGSQKFSAKIKLIPEKRNNRKETLEIIDRNNIKIIAENRLSSEIKLIFKNLVEYHG